MRYLLLVFSFLVVSSLLGQKTFILFENDSFELSKQNQVKLTHLTDLILKKYADQDIVIFGYTDSEGTHLYNDKLSLNRAKAVRDFLQLNGLKNQFHLVGKGEGEIIKPESSESIKAKNRKVVIDLDYVERNISHKAFQVSEQTFKIFNKVDQHIVCENGTEIFFPKFSFETLVDCPIEIKVKECLKMVDFIGKQLYTQTLNNDLLESGGMVKIEATQDGFPVGIKSSEEIQILFKDRVQGDSMQTFYGIEQENGVFWSPRKIKYEYGRVTTWEKYRGFSIIEKGSYYYVKEGEKTIKYETIINARGEENQSSCVMSNIKKSNELALTSNRLGWINCDRFINSGKPLENITIDVLDEYPPIVYIILEDYNSIMKAAHRIDNRFIFKNIPQGAKYKVVAMYRDYKMKNALFSTRKGLLSKSSLLSINLEEISMTELETLVKEL